MCLIRSYENARSQANVVMETTPNLIFIFDKEMRIREFNRRAEDVFHTSRQDALRMYLFELIDTKDFEEVYHTHENKLRVKQKVGTIQYDSAGDHRIYSDVLTGYWPLSRMCLQRKNRRNACWNRN